MDPTAATSTESFIDEYLDSTPAIDKRRALRQGLPPTYRMRHDAHYVDELDSRPLHGSPRRTVARLMRAELMPAAALILSLRL
jgi:hypothetical protein